MFSNDNNVETIAQLIEVAKHYIGLQSEYVKLDVIEKVVKILTAIALVSVFAGLLTISLIYLSFAAIYAMEPYIGSLAIALPHRWFCLCSIYHFVYPSSPPSCGASTREIPGRNLNVKIAHVQPFKS